jgi:hypothetical protein
MVFYFDLRIPQKFENCVKEIYYLGKMQISEH